MSADRAQEGRNASGFWILAIGLLLLGLMNLLINPDFPGHVQAQPDPSECVE
jgi:hypothetical protein